MPKSCGRAPWIERDPLGKLGVDGPLELLEETRVEGHLADCEARDDLQPGRNIVRRELRPGVAVEGDVIPPRIGVKEPDDALCPAPNTKAATVAL